MNDEDKTSAKLICYTPSKFHNSELFTFILTFPRYILPEVNTHRAASKNTSSSRAIPFERMVKDATFVPEYFTKEKPGMQADQNLDFIENNQARVIWIEALESAINYATDLYNLGVHKQQVNRLLEPWTYTTQIFTCETEGLNNLFNLRANPLAQPEFQKLANMMFKETLSKRLLAETEVNKAFPGWHLPFIKTKDLKDACLQEILIMSIARCCSVSYNTVDGLKMTFERAKRIVKKLIYADPMHASPFEHQAFNELPNNSQTSNFHYFIQLRHDEDNLNLIKDYL